MPLARVKILNDVPGHQGQTAMKADDFFLLELHEAEALVLAGDAVLDSVPLPQVEAVDVAAVTKLLKDAEAASGIGRAQARVQRASGELESAQAQLVAAQARVDAAKAAQAAAQVEVANAPVAQAQAPKPVTAAVEPAPTKPVADDAEKQ